MYQLFSVSFQKIVTQDISFSLILIRCWCIFFSESLFHVIHLYYNYSIMNIVKDVISTVVKCGMILYWNKSAFECTSVFLDIANKAWITQFNVFFMYIQYGNNLPGTCGIQFCFFCLYIWCKNWVLEHTILFQSGKSSPYPLRSSMFW